MLRITGGRVYDPANNINGEVRDICFSDGKVVADIAGGRTIDASGMVIFPGGVDVHTHVAGGAINFARAMTPEDHRRTMAFKGALQGSVRRVPESPDVIAARGEQPAGVRTETHRPLFGTLPGWNRESPG